MWLSLGLGLVTLVMTYLGYHYSVPHEVSRTKRWLLRIAFISLAALSLVLIGIQGYKADQSEREAKEAQQEAKASQDRLNATSAEALGNITGVGSVPYIVPQTQAQVDPVPLAIWNLGPHILTGVTATIRHSSAGTAAEVFYAPQIEVGTIHPHLPKLLKVGISPNLDSNGLDGYVIEIATQSEIYIEVLHFRRDKKYPTLWAYRFWVTRHDELGNGLSREVSVYLREEWSDDVREASQRPTPP